MKLLKETSGLDRHSRWSEVKKKINSDPRYEAVDSSSRREDWFKDFVKNLEDVSCVLLFFFFHIVCEKRGWFVAQSESDNSCESFS